MELRKKLAYPYEYFNSNEGYQKPIDNLKKEDFLSKLKNKCPINEEVVRTTEIIKFFKIEKREQLTKVLN